jgi:hypothetical protein
MLLNIFGSGTFCPKNTLIINPIALQTNVSFGDVSPGAKYLYLNDGCVRTPKRHRYFRDPPEPETPEPETPEPESPVPLETLEPETLEPTIRKIIIPTLIKILLQTKACC